MQTLLPYHIQVQVDAYLKMIGSSLELVSAAPRPPSSAGRRYYLFQTGSTRPLV